MQIVLRWWGPFNNGKNIKYIKTRSNPRPPFVDIHVSLQPAPPVYIRSSISKATKAIDPLSELFI